MNIKKLVSAVSALAVAGSVFTGLAVTSYAAVDTAAAEQAVRNKLQFYQHLSPQDDGKYTVTTTKYATYVDGNALATKNRGATNTTSYTLNDAVSSGTVHMEADVLVYSTYSLQSMKFISLKNSSGADVISWQNAARDYGHFTIATNADSKETGTNTDIRNTNNCMGVHVWTDINLDNNTASAGITATRTTGGAAYEQNFDNIAISAGTDIKSLAVTSVAASRNDGATLIDNVKFYSNTANYIGSADAAETFDSFSQDVPGWSSDLSYTEGLKNALNTGGNPSAGYGPTNVENYGWDFPVKGTKQESTEEYESLKALLDHYGLDINTYTSFEATNKGAFTSDEGAAEQTSVTAFTANVENASGKIAITVTPSGEEQEAKTLVSDTELTDATALIGIIVSGLNDASATAVVKMQTVE